MPDFLSSIGNFFSSTGGKALATAVPAIGGEVGNLITGANRAGQISSLENQEKTLSSLTPAQLTAQASSAEAPINAALVQAVRNNVQGDLASRGLAQAPGIFASEESQALAPYAQQNFQTALEAVLAKYNLPLDYARTILSAFPGATNVTPAMTQMLQALAKVHAAGGGSTGGGTDPSTLGPFPGSNAPNIPGASPWGLTPPPIPDTGSGLDFSQLVAPEAG